MDHFLEEDRNILDQVSTEKRPSIVAVTAFAKAGRQGEMQSGGNA